jgi:hypothetical protein
MGELRNPSKRTQAERDAARTAHSKTLGRFWRRDG